MKMSINSSNDLEKTQKIHVPIIWIIVLAIMAMSTTVYSDVEGNWFSSYGNKVAGMDLAIVATMSALGVIIGTLFYFLWGTISDNLRTKYGRRKPIYVSGALSTAGLMFLFAISTNHLWLFICRGVLLGITSNMFHVTNKGLLTDLVPQERRGRINSILIIMGTMGSLIVWIPAIFLLPGEAEAYSAEIHFFFISFGAVIIALSGIILLLFIKEPPVADPPRNWIQDIKDVFDYRELAKHKNFLKVIPAMMLVNMSQSAYMTFLIILLQDIPMTNVEIYVAFAIVGICLAVGFFILARSIDKVGRKIVTLMSVTIAPIGGLVITFSGNDALLFIIGFGIMMPFVLALWSSTDSWVQDLLPKEARGRFLGIINTGNAIGKAPAMIIAGILADQYGILSVFLVSSIILWISIPFFLIVPETLKKSKIKN
jgi:MFS family permease